MQIESIQHWWNVNAYWAMFVSQNLVACHMSSLFIAESLLIEYILDPPF